MTDKNTMPKEIFIYDYHLDYDEQLWTYEKGLSGYKNCQKYIREDLYPNEYFLDPRQFRRMSEELLANYDKFAWKEPYPEDEILKAIIALDSAAFFLETFDHEQHEYDMKNDYQEKG